MLIISNVESLISNIAEGTYMGMGFGFLAAPEKIEGCPWRKPYGDDHTVCMTCRYNNLFHGKPAPGCQMNVSYGFFGDILNVLGQIGLDIKEFKEIISGDVMGGIEPRIIPKEKVPRLLDISKNTLRALQDYQKKVGKVVLSHNERIDYESAIKQGHQCEEEDVAGTEGRLMAIISFCEASIREEEEIIIGT